MCALGGTEDWEAPPKSHTRRAGPWITRALAKPHLLYWATVAEHQNSLGRQRAPRDRDAASRRPYRKLAVKQS